MWSSYSAYWAPTVRVWLPTFCCDVNCADTSLNLMFLSADRGSAVPHSPNTQQAESDASSVLSFLKLSAIGHRSSSMAIMAIMASIYTPTINRTSWAGVNPEFIKSRNDFIRRPIDGVYLREPAGKGLLVLSSIQGILSSGCYCLSGYNPVGQLVYGNPLSSHHSL